VAGGERREEFTTEDTESTEDEESERVEE